MNNSKGFSLIEVMVTMAISMIIIYANAQFMVSMNRSMRGVTLSQEMMEFMQRVMLVTFKPASCSGSLVGQPFNVIGVPTEVTFTEPGQPPVAAGSLVGGLAFTSVALRSTAPTGVPGEYFATLTFTADKTGDVLGAKTLVRSIPLRLLIGGGVVASCVP